MYGSGQPYTYLHTITHNTQDFHSKYYHHPYIQCMYVCMVLANPTPTHTQSHTTHRTSTPSTTTPPTLASGSMETMSLWRGYASCPNTLTSFSTRRYIRILSEYADQFEHKEQCCAPDA